MNKLYTLSIRAQLFVLMACAALPTLLILIYWGYCQHIRDFNTTQDSALNTAKSVSAHLTLVSQTSESWLGTLANNDTIKSFNAEKIAPLLQNELSRNPRFINLIVVNNLGKLVSSAITTATFSVGDRKYFQEIRSSKRFAVGDFALNKVANKPILHFAFPIIGRDNSFQGAIIAALNLEHLNSLSADYHLPKDWSIVVAEENGIRIFRAPLDTRRPVGFPIRSEIFARISGLHPDGIFQVEDPVFGPTLVAYSQVTLASFKPHLYAYIRVPLATATKPSDRLILHSLCAYVVVLVTCLIITWIFGTRLFAVPIAQLVNVTRLIAAGNPLARSGLAYEQGEIGSLAQSIDEMSLQLFERQAKIEQREKENRILVEAFPDTLIVVSANGTFLSYHGPQPPLQTVKDTGLFGLTFQETLPDSLVPIAQQCLLDAKKTGKATLPEYPISTTNGLRYQESRILKLTDDRFLVIIRDITERRKAEKALKESERRFRGMFEAMSIGGLLLDTNGVVTDCNHELAHILGRTPEEVIGKPWVETFIPEGKQSYLRNIFRTAINFKTIPRHLENAVLTKDGKERLLSWDNTLLYDVEGQVAGTASLARDLTEIRALEEQYRHAQKMEAVGQLAGGIAHDFNNILQVISGYADLVMQQAQQNSFPYNEVHHIAEAASRAVGLVRQLLMFSRRSAIAQKKLNLSQTIDDLKDLLQRLIGSSIELNISCEQQPWLIISDSSQIQQIIMNLCINARDAMPHGGAITVSVNNRTIDAAYAASNSWAKVGQYVVLSVTDTGTGIPEELQSKIFDPFFTTKSIGSGTGLGLATVYGIVQQQQGLIHLISAENEGSTFEIYFPALIETTLPELNPISEAISRKGTETILLAEDEETVRSLATEILKNAGYKVLVANNGQTAISLYQQHKDDIALCFLDIVMPHKNGNEVFEEIKSLNPTAKVVFASGFSFNMFTGGSLSLKDHILIEKPYSSNVLLQKVREAIDSN